MRGALFASACWLVGCGGAAPPETLAGADLSEVTRSDSGARVITLRRPTPGRVQLALFVDAGSRDADPPQLATVAAWLAAARAGDDATARVVPDGTEIALDCDAEALAACVERLARALSLRDVDEDAVGEARRRLAEARRRAAADPAAVADRLAMVAWLGREQGRGFAPLGEASDDDALTAANVRAHLAAHFGPARALIVAAGVVEAGEVVRAVDAAFAGVPAASAERAERVVPEAADGAPLEVAVEVGDAAAITVVAALPDLREAAAVARIVRSARRAVSAHAFEVRGGALVLVRGSAQDGAGIAASSEAIAFELARLREERAPAMLLPPRADSAAEAVRELGLRWAHEGERSARGMAIGAVVPGGRGDAGVSQGRSGRADDDEPDASVRERARAEIAAAAARALHRVRPPLRGESRADAASVVMENGARIEARRRAGDQRVAFAVRFAGGAAADPPDAHGRSALLATLAATTCEGLPPGALAARLESLGAALAPAVDAGSWGIVLEAPRHAWRPALDVTLRCALHREGGAIDPDELEHARLVLLDRVRRESIAVLAARALAPRTPGWVAPLGSPDGIAGVGRLDAAAAIDEARVGARTTVSVVGDIALGDAVLRIARRLATLPAGTIPPVAAPGPEEPRDPLAAPSPPGSRLAAVIALRGGAGEAERDPAGARAYAEALVRALAETGAIHVTGVRHGASAAGAWVAVGIEPTEEQLAALPDTLARARRAAGAQARQSAAESARRTHAEGAAAEARPAATAGRLAAERAGSRVAASTERTARTTAAALDAARAHVVISRAN